jgi:hypothetical protein
MILCQFFHEACTNFCFVNEWRIPHSLVCTPNVNELPPFFTWDILPWWSW